MCVCVCVMAQPGHRARNVPPPPEFVDYEPPERVQFRALYCHGGRPDMILSFSTRGQISGESLWHGRYEATPWHGSWRVDGAVMNVCFRYFFPSQILVALRLEWRDHIIEPDHALDGGWWENAYSNVIITDLPRGLEHVMTRGRERAEAAEAETTDDDEFPPGPPLPAR